MRATFLRRPRGAAEVLADATRVVGVISLIVAWVGWSPVDAAVFALVLLGLVVPRFLGVRPALDAAFGMALIVAGWSAVVDAYTTISWWDIPVHFALNGLLAAVAYILAIRLGAVPDPALERVALGSMVVLTVSFGLTAGVVWEWAEWAGHTFVDSSIFVGYEDSLGDLAMGGAGSLVAGLTGRFWTADSRFVHAPGALRVAVR